MNEKKLPSISAWENENNRAEKWKKKATRLRGLLRLYESTRKQRKRICFFCAGEWTHANDCELAEELADDD